MEQTIGFIGAGNMASAMIGGILASKAFLPGKILVSAPSNRRLDVLKNQYGVVVTNRNQEVAEAADILVLAVKPNIILDVCKEICSRMKKDVIVVSIAAGITLEALQEALGESAKIIRAMPNTPCLVGEGMSAIFAGKNAGESDIAQVCELFRLFGKAEVLDEKLVDAVGAVSGSSPAYVFLFLEAMSDAAVKEGMPREQAYLFAAQAVLGAAKMVLDTGEHPAKLKDMVCSPGGTTIEAIKVLEQKGMRAAVIDAMSACAEKFRKMAK